MAVRAVILAAGRGSRLHPFTADSPKCLTEVGGETLIHRQVRTLNDGGVSDIVVVTGYRGEMLALPGTRRIHNARWETTNMVESLFAAEAEFGDDLIAAYGDIVYEPRVLDALMRSDHDVSVVVDRQWRGYWERRFDDATNDAESLRMDGDGRITEIGRKVASLDGVEAQYIGLMRFRGDGIGALSATKRALGATPRPWMKERPVALAYMTDLLMEMVLAGHPVHAVPVAGGWLEIDTPRDHEIAVELVGRAGRNGFRPVEPDAPNAGKMPRQD